MKNKMIHTRYLLALLAICLCAPSKAQDFLPTCCSVGSLTMSPASPCATEPVAFSAFQCASNLTVTTVYNSITWDFGDGTTSSDPVPVHTYDVPGTYVVTVTASTGGSGSSCTTLSATYTITVGNTCCPSCIPTFRPFPGRRYVLGAWASEEHFLGKSTFTYPQIYLTFTTGSGSTVLGPFSPKGNVIDGWQRIEEEFVVPATATDIKVELKSSAPTTGAENVYYDDVRIHPYDAGFKSYVYDPVTLRFVAELDNNNFATFYEYDEEGKLVRVKKETERKTVTIKESRNSSQKRP